MTSSRIRRALLLSNAFGGATMAAYCWLRKRGSKPHSSRPTLRRR